MSNIFKPKKVFLKISETMQRKGLETYCNEEALKGFDSLYKNQLISTLQGALEILIGEPVIIMSREAYETQQTSNQGVRETPATMEENIQHPVPQVQTKAAKNKN